MKKRLLTTILTLSLIGCTSSLTYVNRQTNEIGTGSADGLQKKLTAKFNNKTCEGDYTAVQGGSVGILNTYGSQGNVGGGTLSSISLGGVAFGILKCSDGDVIRCEVKYSGSSGFGVCIGKDNQLYDVMAK
jgi:hypothetical protein